MASKELSKPCKTCRSIKASKGPRPSLKTFSCATQAMKKLTPSSQTFQKLLSSATLMHPEMYDSSKLCQTGLKVPVPLLLEAKSYSPSPTNSEPPIRGVEADDDAKTHFRSTISSQRHLTFPPSGHTESSLELQHTRSPRSKETVTCYDYDFFVNDSTRTAIHTLLRKFPNKPLYIRGSQMIRRHDIAPMIEMHMLAWREDRFVRRLQCNQIAKAEIQTMRSMLGDRTTSAIDNVLVARIGKSDKPADIAGWLCCSIIRHQRNDKSSGAGNGTRLLDWSIATAVNLNKGYNSGSKTYLFGDPESLRERNDLIEVVCKGTRWSQKTEFHDEDFIAITNLVVHPNYHAAPDIRKQLVLAACEKATQLGMPLYVCVPVEHYASVYKDDCGFSELGEHASLSFEPEYRRKYLVYRPSPQSPELLDTQKKGSKSNRFDFGWGSLKDSAK